MKKAIGYVCLIFLLILTGCLAQREVRLGVNAKPKAENSYNWDFGKIKDKDVLTHQFIITNDSASLMHIKDVTTTCGCTASVIKIKTLNPKESATLDVTFKAKGYSGKVSQYVYVNTDNLKSPILKFTITAEVEKESEKYYTRP